MTKTPNFFLVGAPKAGTTSLYHYLDQHPSVYMSAIKEPHYFAAEVREENLDSAFRTEFAAEATAVRSFLDGQMTPKRFGGTVTEWSDYLRLFANARTEPALGEASVCYLWSPSAPQAIAARIPDARILALLRDPADRAFAQYLHGVTNGAIRWSFREHVRRGMLHREGPISVYHPFLEFGMYFEQIRRYRQAFGSNLWIGLYEDFVAWPQEVFASVCRFLKVDPSFAPDMTQRHLVEQPPRAYVLGYLKRKGLWQGAARWTPPRIRPAVRRALVRRPGSVRMNSEDRAYLCAYYREDTRRLAEYLDRDLSAWLRS